MDEVNIARAVHVLGVVLWIGGVGFATTVLLPAVRRMKDPLEPVAFSKRSRDVSPGRQADTASRPLGVLPRAYLGPVEPVRRTVILVDARHGSRLGDLYRDAVYRRALILAPLASGRRQLQTRTNVYPDPTHVLDTACVRSYHRHWRNSRWPWRIDRP